MGNQFFQKIVHLYNSNKLPYAIIASGSALRLVQYFHNRSLWLDEASLALNILDTSFLGLVRPLKFVQAAPIGFLWTEKLAVTIFNGNEYTLRLFPLLSGIISLFLFYGVAKRFLKQEAVPIALCLFAILKPLIYYSSEVKQYSSDVLITILILYYFSKYIYSKRLTASKILWFGMLGAFAVWFSHPSLFILAGVGSVLMLSSIIKKQWKETGFHIIICSFWLISLALNYFVSLRALTRNKHFLTGWAGAFVPSSISSAYDVKWFTSHFFHIFRDTMGFSLSGIAALAFLIGAVSIFQKKKDQFFILILPIPFVLAASLLHTYPIHGRLLLFFVPCLVIFIADGAAEVFDKTKQHQPLIGILFVFILFLYPSLNALKYTINPRTREEIRPVISYIDKHKQNGDVLYIYYDAESAYKYYSRMFNRNKDDYIFGVPSNHNWTGYEKDIDKLRGKKRVWFLFSHVYPLVGFNQMDFYLMHLNKVGKKLDEFRAPGAYAFLYNMNEQN